MVEIFYEFNLVCVLFVMDKYLIVFIFNKGVVVFDCFIFKEVWNYCIGISFFYIVLYLYNQECMVEVLFVFVGLVVFFGVSDGYLYVVDLNMGVYCGKWVLGVFVFLSVVVSGNCLFVVDFGGNIYNFKLYN